MSASMEGATAELVYDRCRSLIREVIRVVLDRASRCMALLADRDEPVLRTLLEGHNDAVRKLARSLEASTNGAHGEVPRDQWEAVGTLLVLCAEMEAAFVQAGGVIPARRYFRG